tara:strand:+ start:841 stop:2430 length:1590 start_codon:yes stop_codon:yes gene_type:complete
MAYGSLGNGRVAGSEATQAKRPENNLEKIKPLKYSATVNQLLLDVETAQTEGSVKTATVGDIEILNTGNKPAYAILAYKLWTAAAVMSANTYHVNYLLKPGEGIIVPDSSAVISDETLEQLAGTVVTNEAPTSFNSNLLWTDSTANLAAHVRPAATDPITITTGSNETNYFRVGDIIQIGRGTSQTDLTEANQYREILRVQSITNTTTMVCERALYGTDAGDYDSANWNVGHASGSPIYLPFFNAYHDVDKYSVAQTDGDGKFKAMNFFGQGRHVAGLGGITPGSVNIKFYLPGYQALGLSGITSATNTGISASTELKLDITVDGGTLFQDLTFTTDSSNANFGGTNGLISKIQSALDTQYYTAGNLFEKRVTVGIINGDLRFTSGSHLSTSAILLADTGDSGSFIDAAANGRIPASGNIPTAVAATLPPDTLYDPVTYDSVPNEGVFGWDDGNGFLKGMCGGTVNYETGAIDMIACPVNAEFVISCLHTSAFSGAKNATATEKNNSLKQIYGNTPNQNGYAELTITRS